MSSKNFLDDLIAIGGTRRKILVAVAKLGAEA